MQRLIDVLEVLALLVGMAMVMYVGIAAVGTLDHLDRGLDRSAILHDQMLKDHVQQLKEHERVLERLTQR
jgi:hypothetical protein